MTLRVVWFFILIDVIIAAKVSHCDQDDQNFEKVLGLRPATHHRPALLYRGAKNETGITSTCLNSCHGEEDCLSFVIFYNVSTCFWFNTAIQGARELENELDTNVAWFIKTCYKARPCKNMWVFERIPGATLVGNSTKVLPKTYTRTECQLKCLNEKDFVCRAAKFRIQNTEYGPDDDITGTCVLSDADRHILPNSFRASSFANEYFENQCVEEEEDQQESTGEFCTYEEYDNATLLHTDVGYQGKTKEQCQELCETAENFNCRGYTISGSTCYLHSEDTKVFGPKLLREDFSGTYFERTPCLNISITCTETYMTVRYKPNGGFTGRMYMEGYSDQPKCFAKGNGANAVVLKLQLISEQCGIIKASAPDDRTLMAGTMILQYNPLVQTQGDRLIRVGCVFGNDSKVLAGTGITITTAPSHGSPLINTTGAVSAPGVEMRVVDLFSQQEISSTQIGQELQLVIELKPDDGSYDMWAGHLVAMTEDSSESILLLDDRGCPTNLNIFPALTKIVTNNTKLLVAAFQAFKFSTSPIVRFSVIIQFCPQKCPPINCGNNEGRRTKRSAIETFNGTKVVTVNKTDPQPQKTVKMPLEYIMIVRSPNANSERLVLSDGKILVAGYDYITDEVCLNYSLFVGLLVTWVLIQVIFVVCCLVMVRRYKKYYENESTTQSLEELNKNFGIGFSNLDSRRVHWADNRSHT